MTISMENEYTDMMIHLEREYEIHTEDALTEALTEYQDIIDFAPRAQALCDRAREQGLRIVFHVFADRKDDFVNAPASALMLYLSHRARGAPNVRLYVELQEYDGERSLVEENALVSYGDFPQ